MRIIGLKRTAVVTACVALIAAAAVLGFAASGNTASGNDDTAAQTALARMAPIPADYGRYVEGELIVELSDQGGAHENIAKAAADAIDNAGFNVVSTLSQASQHSGTMLLVKTKPGAARGGALGDAARDISAVQGVSYVQPNYRYAASTASASTLASDRDVPKQWYLNGPDEHGANVAEAWSSISSTDKVDVAVFDTGMYTMAEYNASGKALSNVDNLHQEFDASNVDLDHAVDFVHTPDGQNPVSLVNDGNPYGDDNGHGTHVSGIIAAKAKTAQTPNTEAYGMAGISQNARIVPIKVLDSGGEGNTADFIAAYDYLISNREAGKAFENLRVVNMSFSLTFDEGSAAESDDIEEGDSATQVNEDFEIIAMESSSEDNILLKKKIAQASEQGVATVCAAGNESSPQATFPSDYKECISVTALDKDGRDAPFTNINGYKDISAPGVDVYSAWGSQADAYATLSGTSQSAAIVSGVLSMMFAEHPKLTVSAAKDSLYKTATPVPQSENAKLQASAAAGSAAADGSAAAASVSDASAAASDTSAGGNVGGLAALSLQTVTNGSHGAIDAAAALAYSVRYADGSSPSDDVDGEEPAIEEGNTPGEGGGESGDAGSENGDGSDGSDGGKADGGDSSGDSGATDPSGDRPGTTPGESEKPGSGTQDESGKASGGGGTTNPSSDESKDSGTGDEGTPKSISIKNGTVHLARTSFLYTGTARKPVATVAVNGKTLKPDVDFSIEYLENSKPGKAWAIVSGKGAYTGTLTHSFKIRLGKVKMRSLTPAKRAIVVKWSRQKKGAVGYQIRYSVKKTMTGAKLKTVKSNSKTKMKMTKLRSGKRYYVQVRTFKKISGKTYRSTWSAKKSAKVR